MLTIFTIPKPFVGDTGIIQKNAIGSWLRLEPDCEVLVFGDDAGIADTAAALGVTHFPVIEKTELGTPLLSSAFCAAQAVAKSDVIVYVNTDIIFFQQLIEQIQRIRLPRFLLCGRRWDLDVRQAIDFGCATWADELFQRLATEGKLHGLAGIDYFVFRRGSVDMLPFAVGRPGWDSWLIYDMRRKEIPVIDASEAVTVVHQNHDFSHSKFGKKRRVGGPEMEENFRIAGGLTNMLTLRDADWILNKDGLARASTCGRIQPLFSMWRPWRALLAAKRRLQEMKITE